MSLPLRCVDLRQGAGNFPSLRVRTAQPTPPQALQVSSPDWAWSHVPDPRRRRQSFSGGGGPSGSGQGGCGCTDPRCGIGTAGSGQISQTPGGLFLPCGYTSPDFQGVVLRKDYDSNKVIFYGPKLHWILGGIPGNRVRHKGVPRHRAGGIQCAMARWQRTELEPPDRRNPGRVRGFNQTNACRSSWR